MKSTVAGCTMDLFFSLFLLSTLVRLLVLYHMIEELWAISSAGTPPFFLDITTCLDSSNADTLQPHF